MIAFMLAHSANDGYNALFPPLLPLIRDHFNLSYTQLGGFLSLFRFFGNYLQIPAGYLSHFISSSTIIASGLLWLSIGVLLASFAKSYWGLTFSLSLAGIGRATYHPLSFSLLSKIFPKEILGRIVGLHMAASSAAHLICPFLVILLANRYGWYWPIRVWTTYGIVVAFIMLGVMKKNKEKEKKPKGKALKLPFISSSLVLYILFRMGWGIARNGMNVFLPLFLIEEANFSIKDATLFYMAQYVIHLFARPLVGAFSDKMGKRKPVIIVECILCCILFLCLTIFKTKLALLMIILAIGLFAGTMPVVGHTYALELIPREHRDRTMGFFFTLSTSITTFSPLIVGFIADYFGLLQSFIILTAIIGISTILLFFTKEYK
jgi:MFS family permease